MPDLMRVSGEETIRRLNLALSESASGAVMLFLRSKPLMAILAVLSHCTKSWQSALCMAS